MPARLEHANLQTRDVDSILQFLQTAFSEFRIRQDASEGAERWVHFGTDNCYIMLSPTRREPAEKWQPYSGAPGLNHRAFVVDDGDALRERMTAAGYEDSTVRNVQPHRRRVYFLDPEGNDWEFIQYLSDDPALYNDYSIPDK